MNSHDREIRQAARWDIFLSHCLKNWVARYPLPRQGRQRLLHAAMVRARRGTAWHRLWVSLNGDSRADIVREFPAIPHSWDLRVHTLTLSIHLHPAWALCA